MQPVLRLPENISGRDFVVGDIHGAFNLVLQAMELANFDPTVDRLFSVGDLIDRGGWSHWVTTFLAQPYVYAVRGNHEDMLLQLYADGEPSDGLLCQVAQHNGFAWWLQTDNDQRREILAALRALPLAIEIPTSRGTVGLIHADVPQGMCWAEFLAHLEAGDLATTQCCLWGRDRIQTGNFEVVPGVGRLFVGHTPQWGGLARYGNVYAVDTGAVFGTQGIEDGRLTLARVLMGTNVLTAPRKTTLVDLRDDAFIPVLPFGHPNAYATPGASVR